MVLYTSLSTPSQTAVNYREEVRVFKKFHANVIGKGGATLRKLREETDTKIELPGEKSDSDVIVIIGRKENVQKARARIEAIEKEMVSAPLPPPHPQSPNDCHCSPSNPNIFPLPPQLSHPPRQIFVTVPPLLPSQIP